jgi:hypothetical protein
LGLVKGDVEYEPLQHARRRLSRGNAGPRLQSHEQQEADARRLGMGFRLPNSSVPQDSLYNNNLASAVTANFAEKDAQIVSQKRLINELQAFKDRVDKLKLETFPVVVTEGAPNALAEPFPCYTPPRSNYEPEVPRRDQIELGPITEHFGFEVRPQQLCYNLLAPTWTGCARYFLSGSPTTGKRATPPNRSAYDTRACTAFTWSRLLFVPALRCVSASTLVQSDNHRSFKGHSAVGLHAQYSAGDFHLERLGR